jgi:hypothetical protein
MSKQTLAVAVGAVVLFVIAIVGAMAFTSGSGGSNVHTMPNGETMTGTMPTQTAP